MDVHNRTGHFQHKMTKDIGQKIPKNHPYYRNPDKASDTDINVLGSLSKLLMGCKHLYAGSAGFYSHPKKVYKRMHKDTKMNNVWMFRMPMEGFKSESIDFSIKDDNVLVKADLGQQGKEDERHYGVTRTIAIPDTVVKEKVTGYLNDQHVFVIEAPYKSPQLPSDQVVPGMACSPRRNSSNSDMDEDMFNQTHSNSIEFDFPKHLSAVFNRNLNEREADEEDFHSKDDKGDECCTRREKSGRQTEQMGHTHKQIPSTQITDFKLSINMQRIPPKFIEVSVKGRTLIVRCNIERRLSSIHLKEYYTTEYGLPINVNMDKLTCVLSDEGVLRVTAPVMDMSEKERRIPLLREGLGH